MSYCRDVDLVNPTSRCEPFVLWWGFQNRLWYRFCSRRAWVERSNIFLYQTEPMHDVRSKRYEEIPHIDQNVKDEIIIINFISFHENVHPLLREWVTLDLFLQSWVNSLISFWSEKWKRGINKEQTKNREKWHMPFAPFPIVGWFCLILVICQAAECHAMLGKRQGPRALEPRVEILMPAEPKFKVSNIHLEYSPVSTEALTKEKLTKGRSKHGDKRQKQTRT